MKTVMSIGAHPDDMEFGCTGTIKQLLRRDYRGVMVLLTNGENGFKAGELPPRERVAVRKREQRKAAHLLGMHDIEFLDNQDGYLEYDEDLRRRIVILLRKYRPEIVFSFRAAPPRVDESAEKTFSQKPLSPVAIFPQYLSPSKKPKVSLQR